MKKKLCILLGLRISGWDYRNNRILSDAKFNYFLSKTIVHYDAIPHNLLIQPDPKNKIDTSTRFQQKCSLWTIQTKDMFVIFSVDLMDNVFRKNSKFYTKHSRWLDFDRSLANFLCVCFVPNISFSVHKHTEKLFAYLSAQHYLSLSRFQHPLEARKRNLRATEYQLSYFVLIEKRPNSIVFRRTLALFEHFNLTHIRVFFLFFEYLKVSGLLRPFFNDA